MGERDAPWALDQRESECFAHTTRPAQSFGSSAPGEELFTPEPDARDVRTMPSSGPQRFQAPLANSRSITSLTLRCSAST
jgi:hypothetical protein